MQAERDTKLEALWREFSNIPIDPETEGIEEEFHYFPIGTHREEIWHWFDERHSKGVYYLLYRVNSPDCDSETCAFNSNGQCRFPLVSGRQPRLHDNGCDDYYYKEPLNTYQIYSTRLQYGAITLNAHDPEKAEEKAQILSNSSHAVWHGSEITDITVE